MPGFEPVTIGLWTVTLPTELHDTWVTIFHKMMNNRFVNKHHRASLVIGRFEIMCSLAVLAWWNHIRMVYGECGFAHAGTRTQDRRRCTGKNGNRKNENTKKKSNSALLQVSFFVRFSTKKSFLNELPRRIRVTLFSRETRFMSYPFSTHASVRIVSTRS